MTVLLSSDAGESLSLELNKTISSIHFFKGKVSVISMLFLQVKKSKYHKEKIVI